MSQKPPVSKHSKREARGEVCRMAMVATAQGPLSGAAPPIPNVQFPVDEILCVHLQFTKLTSDSDVTRSSVHSLACGRDGGGWGTRR